VRQQLFLVDDEHDADRYDADEQHPDDNDAGDPQAQVQTGLLSRRFIAARRRS
jgi:hypothetical protein